MSHEQRTWNKIVVRLDGSRESQRIGGSADAPLSWLRAGEALERLRLEATAWTW
jgi:hypothetical protein